MKTESENSLAGLCVLMTRPARQAAGLVEAIEQRGGRVSHLPLLEIDVVEPTESGPEVERIKSAILALDGYAAAIFVSTNAAGIGMDWIERYWPQLPVGLEAYAVGPGTGNMLRRFPWPVHYPDTGITSEDLLALPGLVDVKGKRIALFRGRGGRELLAATLRERGARVDYIEVYRRRVPPYVPEQVLQQLRVDAVNVVVATSPQILQALLALSGANSSQQSSGSGRDNSNPALLSLLQQLPVLVPSSRVRELGQEAGIKQVMNVGGADDESIVRALMRLKDQGEVRILP